MKPRIPRSRRLLCLSVFILALFAFALPTLAQAPAPSPASQALPINITIGNGTEQGSVSSAIQILFVMTLLTLAPSIMMLMTSFTRLVIVLGFVRSALGVQGAPSNQIIIGLSLFLTIFIMSPIASRINRDALEPYMAKQIGTEVALERASTPLRQFMLKQTRRSELDFFLGISGAGPTKVEAVPMSVAVPAFVVSELRTAFQMGFLVFIPFLIIDFLVASTLMSMGMMMMPPTMISLPFKLLLFVLVDGWHLVIRSLVESFGI
jgi:flagellar biosynthetic protein FliP